MLIAHNTYFEANVVPYENPRGQFRFAVLNEGIQERICSSHSTHSYIFLLNLLLINLKLSYL